MGIATKPTYLGAVAALLGICVAFWAFAVSADAAKETTITAVEPEKGSTFNFVDNAPKSKLKHGFPARFSAGDQVIFTSPVEIEGKRVGRNRVVCTATTTARKFEAAGFVCDGIAKLSNGTLVFAAMLTEGSTEGAITGGTGTYAGAHGTFVSKEGKNSSTTTVTLVE
jgi:hypothetical protein